MRELFYLPECHERALRNALSEKMVMDPMSPFKTASIGIDIRVLTAPADNPEKTCKAVMKAKMMKDDPERQRFATAAELLSSLGIIAQHEILKTAT